MSGIGSFTWDYPWFRADEQICSQVHRIAKSVNPKIGSGRQGEHRRSSWDLAHRSGISYAEMAESADFIKPILYHEALRTRRETRPNRKIASIWAPDDKAHDMI